MVASIFDDVGTYSLAMNRGNWLFGLLSAGVFTYPGYLSNIITSPARWCMGIPSFWFAHDSKEKHEAGDSNPWP